MEKGDLVIVFFGLLLLVSAGMLVKNSFTGYATEAGTSSNVTITKFLSIDLSTNLSDGITFGSVTTLPSLDVNATDNFNPNSTMFINVSSDSNTAVDFCIKANDHLTDSVGGTVIGLNNQTYLNASLNNETLPGLAGSSAVLTTSYVKSSLPTGRGNATFYRFWLDVRSGVASGNYNNTVLFKGVETATAC